MSHRRILVVLALLCVGKGPARAETAAALTVMGESSDPRVAAVRDAVGFWNAELERVGARTRIGPMKVIGNSIPDDALMEMSRAVSRDRGVWGLGRWIEPAPGEYVVVLTNAELMSFAVPNASGTGGVVVLRRADVEPLSLPNVARNVAAHELGHLLGLSHGSDPATLMCGRPAPCRPDAFASDTPRFFPLTPAEETALRDSVP